VPAPSIRAISSRSTARLSGKTAQRPRIVDCDRSECRLVSPIVMAVIRRDGACAKVEQAIEMLTGTQGPVDRRTANLEDVFDLIDQVERFACMAIELVDESDDRRMAQAADLQQLDRAFFDPTRAIDDHQGRIDRGQGAIGIL
jgi:hypothetical protein